MLFDVFGRSGILKREAQPPHLPHLVATRSQHTSTHTIQGVRTMDTLLLNTCTVLQQPTGIQIKNLVSKMLTSCSLSGRAKRVQATNRHLNKKVVSKMLTSCSLLFWDAGQGELTHPGHRLSKRIPPCGTYLLLFIIGGEPAPMVVLRSFVYRDFMYLALLYSLTIAEKRDKLNLGTSIEGNSSSSICVNETCIS